MFQKYYRSKCLGLLFSLSLHFDTTSASDDVLLSSDIWITYSVLWLKTDREYTRCRARNVVLITCLYLTQRAIWRNHANVQHMPDFFFKQSTVRRIPEYAKRSKKRSNFLWPALLLQLHAVSSKSQSKQQYYIITFTVGKRAIHVSQTYRRKSHKSQSSSFLRGKKVRWKVFEKKEQRKKRITHKKSSINTISKIASNVILLPPFFPHTFVTWTNLRNTNVSSRSK